MHPLRQQLRLAKQGKFRSKLEKAPPVPPVEQSSILNADELDRYKNLLLFAKTQVEGYFSGKHRSQIRGTSAEFAEFKSYVPGDDVNQIDWRVYGRTRRLYIREHTDEKDMILYLMVDTSGSMRFKGPKRYSKYELAAKIGASLAYLIHRQGDKSGLALFDEGIKSYLPPTGTRRQLLQVVRSLERVEPTRATGLDQAIEDCASVFKRKGQVVMISDFLDDPGRTMEALSRFVHRKFTVLLLQILDPYELDLPPDGSARYVDMESGEELAVDPADIRDAYRRRMRAFQEELSAHANARNIQLDIIDSGRPYHSAFDAYLQHRGQRRIV